MNTRSHALAERLASGKAKGLGCANEMAREALHAPETIADILATLRDERSVVTIRAANALKKIGEANSALLAPFARELLQRTSECEDLQTRWNLILVVGGLPLRGKDKALAIDLLFEALGAGSGFLRVFALSGLANLAMDDEALRRRVQPILHKSLEDPSAAVRARARKLLKAQSPTRKSS